MSLARGVILGEDRANERLQILVPRGYEDGPPVGKCLVPGCGAVFYRGQESEWQRHVARCASAHIDELRALAPSARNARTIFAEENQDRELERHFRGVRERMAREGRKDPLPSEYGGL